ncbi:MAG: FliA/WhiG family RNA polymerase sigma factor [Planctomycetes bacterium]|nr:FliA/WhiG family RNA polymerase sigma factor [Planctomycetota bacterium]
MVEVATKPKTEDAQVDRIWVTYKRTGDPNLRNVLIERYYPLVRYISERLLATLPKSIELEDLVSAGLFGLMDAIDGFDIERGIKFKTYCTTRIRGSILDELRSQDWVPRLVRLKANKINKAYRQLEADLGREPTDVEMCEAIECSLEEYHQMLGDAQPVTVFSLSDKWDDNQDENTLEKADVLADQKSENPIEALNQRDVIEAITRNLSQKEKRIVIMYYYEGLTMKEIGRILDLTESRVCQIHTNVLQRLQEQLNRTRVGLMA